MHNQRNRFIGGAMYVSGPASGTMDRIYIKPSHDEIQTISNFVEQINQQYTFKQPKAQWVQCMACYLIYDAITLKQVCPHCCGMIPPNVIVSYKR